MKHRPIDTVKPVSANEELEARYTIRSQKYAARSKKYIPYLVGLVVVMLLLSVINTIEVARPITFPVLIVLMVVIVVLGLIQNGSVAKSYDNEHIALKLKETGRERVGVIRSILWRPLVVLTLVIVIGLTVLFFVSDGAIFVTPHIR